MLRGTMEILTDSTSKEMIWQEGDTMYYPEGVTDPDYCLSGGNVCCLYGTDKTGNQQGTSRCYQLCGGVRAVRFFYCLRSRLYQEDK